MLDEYIGDDEQTEKQTSYSLLTFVLLIFILQFGFYMVVNIIRNVDMFAKLRTVSNIHKKAQRTNNNLQYELKSFNSAKSLETIARNNLKMAGKNEILLIINSSNSEQNSEQKQKKPKEKGIFYKR